MGLDMIDELYRYDDWANREVDARLRQIGAPPRALRILGHIAATQWLWLCRMLGGTPPPVWPEWTLDECAAQLEVLRGTWRDALPRIDRSASITYVNSLGERWTSRNAHILTHVPLHGAYHRGQIATIVRDAGETPAYTDFIHCTRAGLLPEA
jgi:uncharacterized damage-inducible protein DinB